MLLIDNNATGVLNQEYDLNVEVKFLLALSVFYIKVSKRFE